jgi:predicted RND superfamily exporter protein/outer membrane lipoprotein-sorting protein
MQHPPPAQQKPSQPSPASRIDAFALRLADRVTAHPWLVLLATLLLVVGLGSGARHLEFANNYRAFFGEENPELQAFDAFQDTYTKNDNLLFVLQPKSGDVFSPQLTEAVEYVTSEAWQVPYAIRVDSISNFQHSWANGDELTVEDLIRDGVTLSAGELDRKRAIALAEPLLAGNLLSPDAVTTGVNVTLQYPEESLLEVPEAMAFARAMVEDVEARYPNVTVALSGLSALNNAFAESGQKDALFLMPLMFAALVVFMIVVLRGLLTTATTLAVILFSLVSALGIAGFLGIEISPISATAPVIIMTMAIADSVHILISMLALMREGHSKREALRESLRINFMAVVITSLTTIVGFLVLNFSDSPPFHDLGNITSVGIAAALLFSLTVLPALISLLPIRVPQRARGTGGLPLRLGRFADWVTARYRPVLLTMAAAAVILIAFVPSIDFNDEWVKYFDHRVDFRGDAEFVIDNLTGIYLVELSLDSGEAEGISDPTYLRNLEALTTWLRQQPEVRHVYSYADIIKRLNKNMHGDDAAWYRLPEDRRLAAQYLLLYELSLPYGLDLNDRVSLDKSATRVTATVDDLSTVEVRAFLDRVRGWLGENTPPTMHAEPTGATVMFSYISQRNIESMLGGNLLAVLLISGILVLALRSFALGALSLIPNALPILMTFGLWALLVGQVGMAAATVSATSLGIVVDDTVHFLTKYLRARREKGLDRPGAIRYAFETVGLAILSTTAIVAFGFSVLALSTFRINAQMGLLTTMAVVIAVVVDFLLLPALLMIGHKQEQATLENPMHKKLTLSRGAVASLLAVALLLPTSLTSAETAETAGEKGYAIAARADRSDRGFTNSTVDLQMVLRNKAGKESTRTLSIRTLEVPDESLGDQSLIVFDSPRDIDGTALLSHARILEPDDQWLYLPALKRVKRISSVNKSGPFVGSEFAFEDFTALELEKYDYKYIRSEPCGDLTCDVVERYPRYEHSGYTRQLSWVDQTHFQVRKVEFYDRRDDLLKTLELKDYRQYEGAYWRSHRFSMVNHQTGKSTDLLYSDYVFGVDLSDGDFVRGALERVR